MNRTAVSLLRRAILRSSRSAGPAAPSSSLGLAQRERAAGFSLVIVILISFGVVLTGLAVLGRASFSSLGTAWQAQSREAREAAELGMARIVSELNRERNRRLLVSAGVLNSWSRSSIESSVNQTVVGSHCSDELPLLSGAFPAGTDLKAVQSIDSQRRYQLVSITQPASSSEREPANPLLRNDSPANSSDPFAVTSGYDPDGSGTVDFPARAGEITITVRGMAIRNNVLVATTTISRTLEVVPKCCWGSLGGYGNAFGPDSRPCPAPPIGFGMVAGVAENSTGSIDVSGAAADIVTGTGETVPFVYCIAASTCSVNVNQNLGTGVKVVDVDMPAMPPAANTTCLDQDNDQCNLDLSTLTTDDALTLATSEFANWPAEFLALCTRNTSIPPLTTCSINRLDFGANNQTLTVDTSGGPLHLYFPNPQSGSEKTLNMRNNGVLRHVSGIQPPARITDFSLFGCQPSSTRSCSEQMVEIGSGSSEALRLFVFIPNGSITLRGNAAFEGVAWVNKLGFSGNIRYIIPASGLADVLTMMGIGGTNPRQPFPWVDYVTRATKSLRFF